MNPQIWENKHIMNEKEIHENKNHSAHRYIILSTPHKFKKQNKNNKEKNNL